MVCNRFGFSPFVVDVLLSDIDHSISSPGKGARPTCNRRIPVDILEKDGQFEIMADVPGVDKEAIHLDIATDTLTISVSQPTANEAAAPPSPAPAGPASTDNATPSEAAAGAEGEEQAEATEAPAEAKLLLRERAQRYAKRALKLPETADLGRARAECAAGVLTVTVPKRALPSPQRIAVA